MRSFHFSLILLLWVKEAFWTLEGNGVRTIYRADGEEPLGLDAQPVLGKMKWMSLIYLPRTKSRIIIEHEQTQWHRKCVSFADGQYKLGMFERGH